MVAGRRQRKPVEDATVTARVGLAVLEDRRYGLDVELRIRLPGMSRSDAEALVAAAHHVCPYSNATRGNIDVRLIIEEPGADGPAAMTNAEARASS